MSDRPGWIPGTVASIGFIGVSLGLFSLGCAQPERGSNDTKPAASLREFVQQGTEADERDDYLTFRDSYRAAGEIVPGHPGILYNLACGEALTGGTKEAVSLLQRLAVMGLYFDVAADDDLQSLRGTARFDHLTGRFADNLRPAGSSEVAFTIDDVDLLPESVAHDPVTGNSLVSSVHRRKILRIDPGGTVDDFTVPGSYGAYGVMGMKADAGRRRLWAATSAVPEMTGYREEDDGHAAVIMYDLDSGTPQRSYEPTLGVVVGDDFFYIANSQWPKFSPGGDAGGDRTGPIVLKLAI